jgi:hypothetical protein
VYSETTLKHRVLLARLKGLSHEMDLAFDDMYGPVLYLGLELTIQLDLAFNDMYGPVLYLGLELTLHVIKGQIDIVRQSL